MPIKDVDLSEAEIKFLISKAKKIVMSQPIFLELESPITVCGDIHGQYPDLLKLFELGGFPPNTNYIFLGDYAFALDWSVAISTAKAMIAPRTTYWA